LVEEKDKTSVFAMFVIVCDCLRLFVIFLSELGMIYIITTNCFDVLYVFKVDEAKGSTILGDQASSGLL